MTRTSPSERGQGMIEMALGSLLFVTVLMLGVYLSETAYLGLKLNEAANFAVWYGTGLRVHHFDNTAGSQPRNIYNPWRTVISVSQDQATAHYAGFDGRSGVGGSGSKQAFSQATPISVTCSRDSRVDFAMPAMSGPDADGTFFNDTEARLRQIYDGTKGGMKCTASSKVASVKIPSSFMDNRGFFHRAHWNESPIHLCGAGRARNGQCTSEFGILLGDWALDGPQKDRANNPVLYGRNGTDNAPYHSLVKELWDKNGGSRGRAASRFAAALGYRSSNVNRSPIDESQFFTSYAGVENEVDYTSMGYWQDTAGDNYTWRGSCFLGRDCGP